MVFVARRQRYMTSIKLARMTYKESRTCTCLWLLNLILAGSNPACVYVHATFVLVPHDPQPKLPHSWTHMNTKIWFYYGMLGLKPRSGNGAINKARQIHVVQGPCMASIPTTILYFSITSHPHGPLWSICRGGWTSELCSHEYSVCV